jgi:hypothetical protein
MLVQSQPTPVVGSGEALHSNKKMCALVIKFPAFVYAIQSLVGKHALP